MFLHINYHLLNIDYSVARDIAIFFKNCFHKNTLCLNDSEERTKISRENKFSFFAHSIVPVCIQVFVRQICDVLSLFRSCT